MPDSSWYHPGTFTADVIVVGAGTLAKPQPSQLLWQAPVLFRLIDTLLSGIAAGISLLDSRVQKVGDPG
jgi:hypothetical protein